MRRAIFGFVFLLVLSSVQECCAKSRDVHEVSVLDALRLSTESNPDLKASQERENEADAAVQISKSPYYPNLNLEGVRTYGFPGSTGALGIGGLMGSPFRSGPAIGLLSQYALVDAPRRYRLKVALQNLSSAKEDTALQRIDVYQKTLRAYFDAARFRSQAELWENIARETSKIASEVRGFVKTGQHSIVEGLLIDDQVEEANAANAGYEEQYKGSLRRLALLTGQPEGSIACPSISTMSVENLSFGSKPASSPLVKRAAIQAEAARMNVSLAGSERLPRVVAMASYGDMEKARLVQKSDYSAGVGFVLPLFEGNQISEEIRRARAVSQQKDHELESAQLELDELNDRFDETINASRVKLRFLEQELDIGRRALTLSKQRYLDFQGSLVDVREAIRNLARVEEQINDTKADLLLSLTSKSVVNSEEIF